MERWSLEAAVCPAPRKMLSFVEEEIRLPDGPFVGQAWTADRQPVQWYILNEIDEGGPVSLRLDGPAWAKVAEGGESAPGLVEVWTPTGRELWTRTESGIEGEGDGGGGPTVWTPERGFGWNEFWITGPTQSGKTFISYVVPALYELFEKSNTVIGGVPMLDMAHDKWDCDFKPAIEQTRFAELMPLKGAGSRGGKLNSVRFRHGPVLRFMGASGSDASVFGYTAPSLVATEIDQYGRIRSETSRAANKLSEMKGRLLSFGESMRIFQECTVSFEDGAVWQGYTHSSTASVLMTQCPHCGGWFCWERGNLVGWRDAETEGTAYRGARWVCLLCSETITEAQRVAMHQPGQGRLVHKGQAVDRQGNVLGRGPDTRSFGFRWTAGNNLFYDCHFLGRQEWLAKRSDDPEDAERKMCQQFWTVPPPPPKLSEESITLDNVTERAQGFPRGLVPAWAELVTWGVDVHRYLLYYTVAAWRKDGTGLVIDYGVIETLAKQLGEEEGLELAFAQWDEQLGVGWAREGTGEVVTATAGGVDTGYARESVIKAIRKYSGRASSGGSLWYATRGYGCTQHRDKIYRAPKKSTRPRKGTTIAVGENYHWEQTVINKRRQQVLLFDADKFKSWVHARLNTPDGHKGALRIYGADHEHFEFAKHLTAEQLVTEKGVTRWRAIRDANHWFDSTVGASLVARVKGVTVTPTGDLSETDLTPLLKLPAGQEGGRTKDEGQRAREEAAREQPVVRPAAGPGRRVPMVRMGSRRIVRR